MKKRIFLLLLLLVIYIISTQNVYAININVEKITTLFEEPKLFYFIIIVALSLFVFINYLISEFRIKNKIEGNQLPESFNSLDVAFYHKFKITYKDILAFIMDLANKDYITIQENEKVLEDTISFVKKAEYTGNNQMEKYLMDELFSNGNVITLNELKNKKNTITDTLSYQYIFFGKAKKIIDTKLVNWKRIMWILMAIIYVFFILLTYQYTAKTDNAEFGVIAILMMSFFSFLVNLVPNSDIKKEKSSKKIVLTVCSIFYLLGVFFMVRDFIALDILLVLGLTSLLIAIFSVVKFNTLSTESNLLHRQVLKFKNFLFKIKPEEIDYLIAQNSNYYYEMLPYAFSFGFHELWIAKGINLNVYGAKWYETNMTTSDIYKIEDFLKIASSDELK